MNPNMKQFSLNTELIEKIFNYAKPLGHNEQQNKLNLGFGFLYYGAVRSLRPRHVMVIGSGFGFSVVCLSLGLKDNGFGRLTFVDPSYHFIKDGPLKTVGGQGMWENPEKVKRHFQMFGVENVITHFKDTSETFFSRYEQLRLPEIDLAFVDGNHGFKHVQYDFTEIVHRSKKNTYIMLHDTNIYVRELVRHSGVKRWLKIIQKQKELFEVLDFPFSSGVAIVRVLKDHTWRYWH